MKRSSAADAVRGAVGGLAGRFGISRRSQPGPEPEIAAEAPAVQPLMRIIALQQLQHQLVDVVPAHHRNADERRSVRSLSGGETFLVSLALALSLGAHLSTLSEREGGRLEAIFLDEGFGSLDAETLETVTGVVTELAAQGRTVGVVTHVKELADQMPVRFEVVTGAKGSTVRRSGAV